MKQNKTNIDFLMPLIEKFKSGGSLNTDKCGDFILKALWVREQAHVFHWQIKSNSHHVALGDFYNDYLDELDELVEGIIGSTGKVFSIGNGSIQIVDYSESNLKSFLEKLTSLFTSEFQKTFPETLENKGIYHTIGDILELISKLKYLLSQQ